MVRKGCCFSILLTPWLDNLSMFASLMRGKRLWAMKIKEIGSKEGSWGWHRVGDSWLFLCQGWGKGLRRYSLLFCIFFPGLQRNIDQGAFRAHKHMPWHASRVKNTSYSHKSAKLWGHWREYFSCRMGSHEVSFCFMSNGVWLGGGLTQCWD